MAALLAGCRAPEDAQQQEARHAAQRWATLRPAYTGEAHCTDAAKSGWFAARPTGRFLCAARLRGGGCDWVQVVFRSDGGFDSVAVSLEERNAGCVLPL